MRVRTPIIIIRETHQYDLVASAEPLLLKFSVPNYLLMKQATSVRLLFAGRRTVHRPLISECRSATAARVLLIGGVRGGPIEFTKDQLTIVPAMDQALLDRLQPVRLLADMYQFTLIAHEWLARANHELVHRRLGQVTSLQSIRFNLSPAFDGGSLIRESFASPLPTSSAMSGEPFGGNWRRVGRDQQSV